MEKLDQFRDDIFDLYVEINLHSLLQKIAEKVKFYLNCEESAIFLYNPEREELYFEIVTGEKQRELKQMVMRKGEGVVGWIAAHEKSVIINDCSLDRRFTSATDNQTDFKTRSIAGVPVIMEGKLLGVIEAINKQDGDFDDNDRRLMEHISNFIAIPLQNAILFRKISQESNEKAQLIELGKTISYSHNLDEIFEVLKNIIIEIIDPMEINVMVKSQRRLYKLIKNEQIDQDNEIETTTVHERMAVFPLRTRNKTLGFLQVELKKSIPSEVASLIKGIAVFAAISIEKVELFLQILEKEKMEREIQIAREIQQSFLLSDKIDLKGIKVAYINIPSSEVGGDYYDVIKLNDHQTIFTINDISGHGIPASLLMSIFRTNFVYRIKKDRDILSTINHLNNLIAETTDTNLYVTSFSCIIDSQNNTIKWINAGHIPPFILRGNELIELKNGGLVLGMFQDISFQENGFDLKKDDLIVLFTDGVTEAEDCKGIQFSTNRFINFLQSNQKDEVEVIKDKIIRQLRDYVERDDFQDDVTFILIKIT
ncbi:MAG: SpoIIE family protein phosphatase [Candidatus Aminicenantes bacterium]|nr:SpoIIE family protein phosphatase [Candidatus Aminicenantes bacterium]